MKTRVISAVIALMIFVPILLMGGIVFDIAVCILSVLALKEFMDIKETKKKNFIAKRILKYCFQEENIHFVKM